MFWHSSEDLNQPVKEAELSDPTTGQWQTLAAEDTPRLYHSASVLLPDGRILSTGGGEYRPDGNNANDLKDSRRDAQSSEPPDSTPSSIGSLLSHLPNSGS